MMNRRRSISCFGGLLVATALVLAPAIVHAQTGPAADPTAVTITPVQHDKLLVQWTYSDGANTAEYFEVGYAAHKTATTFVGIAPMKMKAEGGASALSATITGLKSATKYLVGVRAVNSMDGTDALDPVQPSAWVYDADGPMTGAAPKPGDVDDRDIMVMEGDMELILTWDRHPTPGASGLEIAGYMIEYSPKKDFSADKLMIEVGAVNRAVIANLMNGMTYYIRMKAENDAGGMSANWSEAVMGTPMAGAMPTPTPALPLFGAFALGAGLLAAGRARLRRREQRQLTR